jgi:hypothetical protein
MALEKLSTMEMMPDVSRQLSAERALRQNCEKVIAELDDRVVRTEIDRDRLLEEVERLKAQLGDVMEMARVAETRAKRAETRVGKVQVGIEEQLQRTEQAARAAEEAAAAAEDKCAELQRELLEKQVIIRNLEEDEQRLRGELQNNELMYAQRLQEERVRWEQTILAQDVLQRSGRKMKAGR